MNRDNLINVMTMTFFRSRELVPFAMNVQGMLCRLSDQNSVYPRSSPVEL